MRILVLLMLVGCAPMELRAQTPPEIRGVLVPGQTQVCVNLTPVPGAAVRLYVRVNDSPVSLKELATGNLVGFQSPDSSGLQQCLNLATGLVAGDLVIVSEQSSSMTTTYSPAVMVANDPLDLGRVRYYFTSGVVLSNNQGFAAPTGTQAALFLELDADRAWLISNRRGWRRVGINTYFDAQLTSVATQGTAADNISTYLQSRKAGILQVGAYLPVMTTEWKRGTTWYSSFVAPLGKVGLTTVTDQASTTTAEPTTGRFFTFSSYGTRLGVSRTYKSASGWDESRAPELIGYVDLSVGRFGNFEVFRDLSAQMSGVQPGTEFLRQRPWRYSFEGLLKVPHSIFTVGFSANVGRGAHAGDRANGIVYPFTQAYDDLRFLFGAQFDVKTFLKAIPSPWF